VQSAFMQPTSPSSFVQITDQRFITSKSVKMLARKESGTMLKKASSSGFAGGCHVAGTPLLLVKSE
jgi:hypothetical protein